MSGSFNSDKDLRSDIWKWSFWIFFFIVVFSGLAWFINLASVPGKIVSKTLDPDNIIHNYEWFHDFNGQYKSRLNQISGQKAMIKDLGEVNNAEKVRLAQELSAIRQSCRDIVTRYNANATKTNRSIFMGREAPEKLEISTCEQ
jgi:hypothetical protein